MRQVKITKNFVTQLSKELGQKIELKNQFKSGRANPVFPIKLKEGNCILKLYDKRKLRMFMTNIKVYGLLKKEKLITDVVKSGKWEGGRYLVLKKIEGKDFTEVIKDLSQKDINKIAFDLGKIVAKFHSLKNDQFGELYSPKFKNWKSYLEKLNNNRLKKLKGHDFEYFIPRIRMYLKENEKLIIDIKKGSFVHDDLQPQNFIINKKKLVGVIDFDGVFWGDPMFELPYIESSMKHVLKSRVLSSFIERFYRGYESVKKLNWKKREKVEIYYSVCKLLRHMSGFPSLKERLGKRIGKRVKKSFISSMEKALK